MGVKVEIGGSVHEVISFSVQEASTPLAGGDSSGQVGSISISIPKPDSDVQFNNPFDVYGLMYLIGKEVKLTDSYMGYTLGKVESANYNPDSGLIDISALSKIGDLNIYNVRVEPFSGFLGDAFEYYLSIAEITSGFLVLDTPERPISIQPVAFPGWEGELWFNLKQMAASIDCEISLVSGLIVLRPVRTRTIARGRDISRALSLEAGSLAKSIEVNYYNNRSIVNELVYPAGGWNPGVEIISVNAGETIERDIELSAYVSSIQQPQMVTFVDQYTSNASVYTISGNDGLPISPSLWSNTGGSVTFSINEDSKTLRLRISAPTGLPSSEGEALSSFSIALASDTSSSRYSTLRILGTGVAFEKKVKNFPTGVAESEAASDVGITIDNIFINTVDDVNRVGMRAIRKYNGSRYTMSGSLVSVNNLGDTGIVQERTYEYFAQLFPSSTYEAVQAAPNITDETYFNIQNWLNQGTSELFTNQVFGNVAGARMWDETSRRWYRIRDTTLNYSGIGFSAEDDLLHEDIYNELLEGNTYATVLGWYDDLSYAQVDLLGISNAQS